MDEALKAQENEITEHMVYKNLAKREKENREVLERIADDELNHYGVWKSVTRREIKEKRSKVIFYEILAFIFGITFALKIMENGEKNAQKKYADLAKKYPQVEKLIEDENKHEVELLKLINEERLNYVGAMVLGMNDALVELTGTLAGLTFALRNNQLISLAGLITGIAAALSMAASEYLSTRAEGAEKKATKAALYTGIAYIVTVVLIISPFFLPVSPYASIGITLMVGVVLIAIFTFYVSVVQDISFKKRFAEMASISLGVALLSFLIGSVVRVFLGVDV
ncbi:MAG: VIT1/CCC1 transporter family protein [Candidatus Thermoplasmatota archaeon]|nr:VIT1/CCC1 transporter family protein [Candidatus Thermoplasmatota archaeon]